MKIAIYSRKSKFTGRGESIGNQIEMCKDYISMHYPDETHTIKVFEDEGFSGKNLDRPQFKAMMDIENIEPFDLIIVYRLDRISRNVSDFALLIDKLTKNNTSFVCIKEQFDTRTPMGRAMMNIAAVFAQLERETIAERIKDNMYILAKDGHWLGGTTPLGYKSVQLFNGNRSYFTLEFDKTQIDLVHLIFQKYNELNSINAVETYLTLNNYKTQRGNYWDKSNLKRILSNPIYCIADEDSYNYFTSLGCNVCFTLNDCNGENGIYPYNRFSGQKRELQQPEQWIITVSEHKGILTGKEWIEVQNRLKANSTNTYGGKPNKRRIINNKSLLSGILFCSCGAYMRPKIYPSGNMFYICENKMDKKLIECHNSNINGDELDKIILNEIFSFDVDNSTVHNQLQALRQQIANTDNELLSQIKRLQTQIENNKSAINQIINVVTLSVESNAPEQVINLYNQKMNGLIEQNKTIENRIQVLKDGNVIKTQMTNQLNNITDAICYLKENFDKLSITQKRDFIKQIIEKIIWDGCNIHIFIKGVSN